MKKSKQEELEEKILNEFKKFKKKLLEKTQSEIFDKASEIYFKKYLTEYLMEKENTTQQEKEELCAIDEILDTCCVYYMDVDFEDSYAFFYVIKEIVNKALRLTMGLLI